MGWNTMSGGRDACYNVEPTYSESAHGEWITAKRVHQEINAHGISGADEDEFWQTIPAEKFTDAGVALYDAGRLMEWLGY